MDQKTKNLDILINKIGYMIVEEIKKKGNEKTKYKNEIEKALGVLSNDGVYAFYVYVKSKKIDDVFLTKLNEISEIIKVYEKKKSKEQIKELNEQYFEKISENLNSLLFFREILEKILIYARYHAKAMEE